MADKLCSDGAFESLGEVIGQSNVSSQLLRSMSSLFSEKAVQTVHVASKCNRYRGPLQLPRCRVRHCCFCKQQLTAAPSPTASCEPSLPQVSLSGIDQVLELFYLDCLRTRSCSWKSNTGSGDSQPRRLLLLFSIKSSLASYFVSCELTPMSE